METSTELLYREQELLREYIGSLEKSLENKLRQRLSPEFAARLDAALRSTDTEITFLTGKVKVLEAATSTQAPKPDEASKPVYTKVFSPQAEQKEFPHVSKDAAVKIGLQYYNKAREFGKSFSFAKYVETIAFVQLVLLFMVAIERFDQFGVVIIVALYACHELDKKALGAYIVFTAFSVILDISWLITHADAKEFAVTKSFQVTHQFVWVVSLLALILKVLVLFPAFVSFRSFPDVKPSDQQQAPKDSPLEKAMYVGGIISLAIVFAISLSRADLFSLILILLIYAVHEDDKQALAGYFILLFFSILVDITWLGLHGAKDYLDHTQSEALANQPETFAFAMTIVNLFLKLIFTFPAVIIYRQYPESKPSENAPNLSQRLAEQPTFAKKFYAITQSVAFGKATTALLFIQFVLCMFQTLARLDIYAIAISMALYAVNEKDKLALEAYFVFSFISVPFDIVWLAEHSQHHKFIWQAGTSGAVAFVAVCICLNLFLKVVTLIPAIKHYTELPDIKPSEAGSEIGNRRAQVLLRIQNFRHLGYSDKVRRVMMIIGIIQLALFFLIAIDRVDPFCIIIPMVFYAIHEKDRTALIGYLVFMDFSIILDIVWLSLHSDDLKVIVQSADSGVISSVKPSLQFVYAMSIISILVKFIAHIPAILLYRQLPVIKPSDEGTALDAVDLPLGPSTLTSSSFNPGTVATPPGSQQMRFSSKAPGITSSGGQQRTSMDAPRNSASYGRSSYDGSQQSVPVQAISSLSGLSDLERAIKEREERLASSGY